MARYHPYFEEKLKRAIRDAIAIDPLMSKAALHRHLEEQFDHSFDLRFIGRIAHKVARQALIEADRTQIEFFVGGHVIHGQGTFAFLRKHLK